MNGKEWLFHKHTAGWWAYPKGRDGCVDFTREEPRGPFASQEEAIVATRTIKKLWADERWWIDGRLHQSAKHITIWTGTGEQPCTILYLQVHGGSAYHNAARLCSCVNALEGLDPNNSDVKAALKKLRDASDRGN